MGKLKEYKYIILILLIILGFAFYWYEWRPTNIRKDCFNRSQIFDAYADRDKAYEICVMSNGINK